MSEKELEGRTWSEVDPLPPPTPQSSAGEQARRKAFANTGSLTAADEAGVEADSEFMQGTNSPVGGDRGRSAEVAPEPEADVEPEPEPEPEPEGEPEPEPEPEA